MPIEPSGAKPPSFAAPPSIAPVGLEAPPDGHSEAFDVAVEPPKDRAGQSLSIRLPLRRRRLGGIVIATVGGCTLLLVAAVIARVSQASSGPRAASKEAPAALAANISPPSQTPRVDPVKPPTPDPAAIPPPPPASELPTSGTVRVARPATPGRVWLDGKKLSATTAVVMCGPHQIRVGTLGRARSVQVPCGGELVVSR